MKKILGIIALSFFVSFISAQTTVKVMDEKSQTMILVGETNIMDIKEGVFGENVNTEYAKYLIDTTLLQQINTYLKSNSNVIKLTIVLGTWCGDSKEQVPRFYSIYDKMTTKFADITLIGVDRLRKAGDLDISDLKIEKVPTFIFYRDGVEIGRITETPMKTIENDMMRILSTK